MSPSRLDVMLLRRNTQRLEGAAHIRVRQYYLSCIQNQWLLKIVMPTYVFDPYVGGENLILQILNTEKRALNKSYRQIAVGGVIAQ